MGRGVHEVSTKSPGSSNLCWNHGMLPRRVQKHFPLGIRPPALGAPARHRAGAPAALVRSPRASSAHPLAAIGRPPRPARASGRARVVDGGKRAQRSHQCQPVPAGRAPCHRTRALRVHGVDRGRVDRAAGRTRAGCGWRVEQGPCRVRAHGAFHRRQRCVRGRPAGRKDLQHFSDDGHGPRPPRIRPARTVVAQPLRKPGRRAVQPPLDRDDDVRAGHLGLVPRATVAESPAVARITVRARGRPAAGHALGISTLLAAVPIGLESSRTRPAACVALHRRVARIACKLGAPARSGRLERR